MQSVTLILRATDETYSLKETVRQTRALLPEYQLHMLIVTHPRLTTQECQRAIREIAEEFGDNIEAFEQRMQGLGGALREAFGRTKSEVLVLMAADLETDPKTLPSMLKKLEEGWDIVATSRWKSWGRFYGYSPVKLVLNLAFQ